MKVQISASQAVVLLVLSRMFRTVTYSPMFENLKEASAIVYADAISIIATIIIMLPLFILMRKTNVDILIESSSYNKIFGKAVMIYYFFLVMLILVNTTSRFESFMSNAIFPNIRPTTIIITFLLVCVYGAKMGLEAISRASTIIFVIFIISVCFIIGFSFEKIDLVNIKPLIYNPTQTIFQLVVNNISHNMEFVLLILILPKIKGKFSKVVINYLLISGVFIVVIGGLTVSILGDFTLNQIFPFFSIASIMEGGTIQRMDSIHMSLWVLISYVRVTLCLIVSSEISSNLISRKVKKSMYVLCIAIIVGVLSYFISLDYDRIKWIPKIVNTFIPIFVATFIIPTIILFIRRKNKNEKISTDS